MDIHDAVQALHLELMKDRQYQILHEATCDEDSPSGALLLDDMRACKMIRELARHKVLADDKSAATAMVAEAKIAVIRRSINVVRRNSRHRKRR